MPEPDDTFPSRLERLLRPTVGEESPTILAVLPWLGVPVLVSAALARAGMGLPGEVLPVVAFLPLVALAYVTAIRVPARWRALAVGVPGFVLVAVLLVSLVGDLSPGVALTFWVALAAAALCTLVAAVLGRVFPRVGGLASVAGAAMVFCQALDGWLTYLSVGNPFGWLDEGVSERVVLSRFILEAAPELYPLLKVGLAVGVAIAIVRPSVTGATQVLMTLVVCYAGLSPAMFSAANLFG